MVTASTQTLWTLPPAYDIENCPTPEEQGNDYTIIPNVSRSHLAIRRAHENNYNAEYSAASSVISLHPSKFGGAHSLSYSDDAIQRSEFSYMSAACPAEYENDILMSESDNSTMTIEDLSISTSAVSPPQRHDCVVCGDVSSGFHCGAYVCEACKKFYARACKQGTTKFKCNNEGNEGMCVINKSTRALCQLCRYNKCVDVGMLPPGHNLIDTTKMADLNCKVCKAPASGFHFGVLSCESCKSFYRRILKRKTSEPLICRNGGNCLTKPGLRPDCRACRNQMCIQAGMSADLTRIGRQPNSVRHSRIVENKPLQQKKDVSTKALVSSSSPISTHPQMSAAVSLYPGESSKVQSCLTFSGLNLQHLVLPTSPSSELPLLPANKSWMCRLENQRAAYVKLADNLNKDWAYLVFELEAAGSMSDYKFISTIFKRFKSFLTFMLEFLKQTDGFSEIDLMDRIVLTKAAIFRTLLLVGASHYNLETGKHQAFIFPSHSSISDRYYHLLPEMRQSAKHFEKIGRVIRCLNFDVEELCLMAFLNVINQENLPRLRSAELVEQLYESYTRLLVSYLTFKQKEPLQRLSEIRMVLRACSDAAYQHSGVAQSTWQNHSEYVTPTSETGSEAIPTVFSEVYSP